MAIFCAKVHGFHASRLDEREKLRGDAKRHPVDQLYAFRCRKDLGGERLRNGMGKADRPPIEKRRGRIRERGLYFRERHAPGRSPLPSAFRPLEANNARPLP